MNKKILYIWSIIFIVSLILTASVMADSCCDHSKSEAMDHKSNVDGYQLEYQFIDMKEKMKGMADMPEMAKHLETMAATHHLMVFIKTPKGDTVAADKVGFLIDGPDGKVQKVMAMGMSGGYGADVNLSQPGAYTVKTKALLGETRLMDDFNYTVR